MSELWARLQELSPEERRRLVEEWRSRSHQESTPPIQRVSGNGGDFPLSFAQERLWFLDQMTPGNPFYNIASAQRIPFAVDGDALDGALSEVVRRHGVLRTIYPVSTGAPVQRLLPPHPVRCARVDFGELPTAEKDARLQELAEQAAQQPFDLSSGPVFRATLVRLGPAESAFLLVVHHIATDVASMEILFRELGTLYADAVSGRAPTLRDTPLQYADFAVWQRRWLQGERLRSQVDYWTSRLADTPTLALPTDRPRPPVQAYRGAHLDVRVPKSTREALYGLGRECSATPFMVLLTAFYVLLQRYSQQDDLAVGVPIANRARQELEGVIGFFANSVVMRANLAGNPTVRSALARVREVALEAYSHQDVPFSAVVAAVRPPKDLSRNPLYQVSFQLVSEPGGADSRTMPSSAVTFERGSAIFDLALNLWEAEGEIRGLLEYSSDLFDRDTAGRMIRHYLTLLESIAADPDAPVATLPLLAPDERRRILVEWNDTAAPSPSCTVHALVEEQVRRTPAAVAVQKGTTALGYAELDARASRVAALVRADDDREGRAVGLMLPTGFDLVAALLGILKSGNAYVPLDPSTPPTRLARMLADAGVDCVVTTPVLAGRVPDAARVLTVDGGSWDNLSADDRRAGRGSASDLAYVLFTSGSSGTPKGVMVPHSGVVNYLSWCRLHYPVDAGAGVPLCSPVWSDMSVTALFLPLVCGSRIVLLEEDDVVDSLDAALRSGARFDLVKLTPSHLEALRTLSPGRGAPSNAAAFVVGGEALHSETLAPWRAEAPDLVVFNEYGPTETVVGCAVHRARAGDLAPGPVPIGRPIANTRLYVLDRHGQPVPVGVPGELYIAGSGVARGYAGAAALTEERFVADPFGPGGDRMYRTGDLVRYRADGTLEFLGRIDRQVKIRGYRIEPAEIEAAIRRQGLVADVAVTVRELGHGDRRLVAHVVLAGDAPEKAVAVPEIRERLRGELPPHMMPGALNVVDSIPLTAAGKSDLRQLEALSAEPVRTSEPVAPATALENVVALVFGDVLGVASLSVDDDFFSDLGGHSLLATQAVARLRELLRFDLPLRWLFESPTVRRLAAAVGRDPGLRADAERVAETVWAVLSMPEDNVRVELTSRSGPRGPTSSAVETASEGSDPESTCA